MKRVMTLLTQFEHGTDMITVCQVHHGVNSLSAQFSYNIERGVQENHQMAAERWLELKGSGRSFIPYVHEVSGGYLFGMV